MSHADPHSARAEAERLVATALAVARRATNGPGLAAGLGALGPLSDVLSGAFGHHTNPSTRGTESAPGHGPATHDGPAAERGPRVATGDPECCVCPICRTIVALRDPSPEFAERLATGAGDFAAGVASLLRALNSSSTGAGGAGDAGDRDPGDRDPGDRDPGDREPAGHARHDDDDVWRAATRNRDDVDPARADDDVWAAATADQATPVVPAARPAKPMARKAVKRAAPPAPRDEA